MNLSRLTAGVGVVLLTVAVVAATRPTPTRPAIADAEAAEVRRIQIHLDSALALLRTNDAGRLTATQRARRIVATENLRIYRNRGVFPRNYDFSEKTPYFVDRKTGTLCAVAYLLSTTGRNDIVDRVERANNNVRVRELAGDTALTQWLEDNGLTLDEAAFIQVVYANQPSQAAVAGIGLGLVATIPTIVTATWNLGTNSDGHRPWVSNVGLVAGAASIAAGAQMLVGNNASMDLGPLAKTSIAMGALGVAASVQAIVHHKRLFANETESARRTITEATISPIISSDRSRTGMAVSLRF